MVKSNILRIDALSQPFDPAPSRDHHQFKIDTGSRKKTFIEFFYNKEKKEYFGRTCSSWFKILIYSVMYLIFLSTYTLILLYVSLLILKSTTDFSSMDKIEMLTYSERIGLTASPISDLGMSIISYRKGVRRDYEKYINALDKLLLNHKRNVGLGPCGKSPYGYGDRPCVIIRINKQFSWAGKPLDSLNNPSLPLEIQRNIRAEPKLWLHCNGVHSYDKEHIGRIKYHPDPPGFDPNVFPLREDVSPLVAVQFLNITEGISLAVECKLWYEKGPSTIEFMIYVAP